MSTNEKQYEANNIKAVFLISVCIILIILTIVQVFRKNPKISNQPTENPVTEEQIVEEPNQGIIGKQAFINKYENFEQLKLENLPIISDVRNVFEYKDNLVVVGSDLIIEYNPETNELIRTNSNIFPNISEATKIDNYLYVGVNAHAVNKNYDETKTTGDIYIVNLDTGIVEDEIVANKDIPNNLVNLDLATSNGDLWVLGGLDTDGSTTYRINPKTKEILGTYTAADLGFNKPTACNNSFKFAKKSESIQVVEFACKNFVSTYDYETDKWDIELKETLDAAQYINLSRKDFGITVPYFYTLTTAPSGGKHYAIADTGIYEITKNSLPTKLFDTKLDAFMPGYNMLALDESAQNLVLISSAYGGIDAGGPANPNIEDILLSEVLKVYIVNLDSGEVTDLITTSEELSNAYAEKYLDAIFKLTANKPNPKTLEDEIKYIDSETNETLVTITPEKQLLYIKSKE